VNGESFNDLTGTGLALSGSSLVTSNIPNTSLQNSTISGISLGSNLANLSATDNTLTFSGTYNGGTARTIGLNLGNANTWTANQTFNYSSSTIYSSFATASTTNLVINGQSFNNLLGSGLTNAGGTLTCATASGSTAGCLSTTDYNTFNSKLSAYDPFTHPSASASATTSAFIIATSTGSTYSLTVHGPFAPQLALSAGSGIAQWTLRNAGGYLYFATTTVEVASDIAPVVPLIESADVVVVLVQQDA
jgi:hypothetical protein